MVAQGEAASLSSGEPWESGALGICRAPEARQMKCAGRWEMRYGANRKEPAVLMKGEPRFWVGVG